MSADAVSVKSGSRSYYQRLADTSLTLGSKHDVPPLDVEAFKWLRPLSASLLSPRPTADDGRQLWGE